MLLAVVFLPFPSGLVANALHSSGDERVFVTLYGLTLMAIRILGFVLDTYARHEQLYTQVGEGEELQGAQREFRPVILVFLIAIGIGLLVPFVAVALYYGIAVYLIVPFREAARVLIQRRSAHR